MKMNRLLLALVAGFAVLTGSWAGQRMKHDPLQEIRGDFMPIVGHGDPPVSDYEEVLWNDKASLADWKRVRDKILSSPEFARWHATGDLRDAPLPGWQIDTLGHAYRPTAYSIQVENPRRHEAILLVYGGDFPGMKLTYSRPFELWESDIAFFRGDR